MRPRTEPQAIPDGHGIPQDVVEADVPHDARLTKAWRAYRGLTQQQVCVRAGLLLPALTRMENAATVLRKAPRGGLQHRVQQEATVFGLGVEMHGRFHLRA